MHARTRRTDGTDRTTNIEELMASHGMSVWTLACQANAIVSELHRNREWYMLIMQNYSISPDYHEASF
jgi:hypothetical protein